MTGRRLVYQSYKQSLAGACSPKGLEKIWEIRLAKCVQNIPRVHKNVLYPPSKRLNTPVLPEFETSISEPGGYLAQARPRMSRKYPAADREPHRRWCLRVPRWRTRLLHFRAPVTDLEVPRSVRGQASGRLGFKYTTICVGDGLW